MKNILHIGGKQIRINWNYECGIIQSIIDSNPLEGIANNIEGEVFFYQYELDIPFNGEEHELFEIGDIVYWRSPTDSKKFGILFMYGNTEYGDGTKPRASSPGIKIGTIEEFEIIADIPTGKKLKLG